MIAGEERRRPGKSISHRLRWGGSPVTVTPGGSNQPDPLPSLRMCGGAKNILANGSGVQEQPPYHPSTPFLFRNTSAAESWFPAGSRQNPVPLRKFCL